MRQSTWWWAVTSLLLLTSCGPRRPSDGDEPGGDEADPWTEADPASVPDDLPGHWQTILTYVPAYFEGVIPNGDFIGSIGVFFTFWPDASYEFDLNTALTYFGGNCFRTTRWRELGEVAITGSAYTFHANEATSSIMDSCDESSFTNADPGEDVTLTVTAERDETGWPMLRMRLPTGEDLLLERCRDCE